MSRFGMLLAGALLTGFAAFAQDSAQTPPATTPQPASPRHSHMRSDRVEQKLKRLSKNLNLTDDQREKIRPILQDEEKHLTSLDSDTVLTEQQKHRKMREIRMSSRSQIEGILTAEQKEKLPSRGAGAGGRHHPHTSQGSTSNTDQSAPQ